MIVLQCACCGFAAEFTDGEAAFQAGWDAPPHFTGYVACNLCPAAFIVTGQTERHAPVHDVWAAEGRPAEFSQEACLMPEDRIPEAKFNAFQELLDELVAEGTFPPECIEIVRIKHGDG